jgi:Zn-finger nucleic acid-binding protein
MLRCQNCSAPLAGFNGTCEYCGSYNNIDRDLLMRTPLSSVESPLACPGCGNAMVNIELGKDGGKPLCADQCGTCFGLFFPFFKLDVVLNDLSRFGFLKDMPRLTDLSRNIPIETKIVYRKCPVCAKIMNRLNFGRRSGVVTDQCHGHGIWLDAGELQRLVEWRNAGGKIVDEEYRKEEARNQMLREKRLKEEAARRRSEANRREPDPDSVF